LGHGELGVGSRLRETGIGLSRLHVERAPIELDEGLTRAHPIARLDEHVGHANAGELDAQRHLLPRGDRTRGDDFTFDGAPLGNHQSHGEGRGCGRWRVAATRAADDGERRECEGGYGRRSKNSGGHG
jgi:hypothetical protein